MNTKRLLIVDDDPRNVLALTAVLRARAFECVSCMTAGEALKILQSNEPLDAVLIDMMMPEMDGYEAIPLIKKIPSRMTTPVISVTAQAMLGDKEKCIEMGMDDYISKPIDFNDLDKLIEKWLS